MRRFRARVESVGLHADGSIVLSVTTPAQLTPRAGQPVLALQPGVNEPNRHVIYPIETTPSGFTCIAPSDRIWRAGDELDLLGPIGSGFAPPASARRWLLLSVDSDPGPLMPLITLANNRNASVSLWASVTPSDLSPDVEVATDLPAALDWADFVAICTTPTGLPELRTMLGPVERLYTPARIQALIMEPMPCGIGGCTACAIRVRRGWKLACLDGPVFPLDTLAW
jgi:dihydroorotate dehydrogenase electron transfer subunit